MTTLEHDVVRQTARQSTTSNVFGDVAGCSIPSTNFTPGKDYLLFITGKLDCTDTSRAVQVRLVHGATTFHATEQREETDATASKLPYFAWAVYTALAGEDVKIQMRTETSPVEVGIRDVEMKWFCLSDDLVQGVDWDHHLNTTPTPLGVGETAINNGSVTITPPAAGQKLLVLSKAEFAVDSLTVSYQSRLLRTGEAAETLSELIKEGEDASHVYNHSQMAVVTAGAVANTFTEKALLSGAGLGTENRNASGIFVLNLSRFKVATIARTLAKTDLSAADFGTQLETISITPVNAGPVWAQGFWVHDTGAEGIYAKTRLQVGNVDDPANQTSNAFQLDPGHDARDQMAMMVGTLSTQTAAAHTYDLDASTSAAVAGRGGMYRSFFAVTMELADDDEVISGNVTPVWHKKLTLGTETTGGSITIDADTLEHDLLTVEIVSRDHNSGIAFASVTADTEGAPALAAWTRKGSGPSRKGNLYWRRGNAVSPGKVITIGGAVGSCAVILSCYRGAYRTGDPITNFSAELNEGGDPKEHAAFTPDFDNSMICATIINHTNDTPVTLVVATNPASLITRLEALSTGGNDCGLHHASAPQVGARASTGVVGWTQGANQNASLLWAIRPEPAAAPPPTQAEALCKPVPFNTGTGVADIPIDFGFEPIAVFFMLIGRTEAADAGGNGDAVRCLGFAADCAGIIRNRCAVSFEDHNQAAASFSAQRAQRNDVCLAAITAAGAFAGRLKVGSITGTGCVLTIDQAFGANYRAVAWGIGGTDPTQCAIGTIVTPTAGSVPLAQDVPIGFDCTEGQAIGFLLGTGATTENIVFNEGGLSFGAFVKAHDGVFWGGATDHDVDKTKTRRHCSRRRPWASFDASAQGFSKLIQFDGWTPGNIRLNHDQLGPAAEIIYYLVIKGGRWGLAEGFTAVSDIPIPITGAAVGTPVGGLLVSAFGQTAHAEQSTTTTDMSSFGMFSSPTDRYAMVQRDEDSRDPSNVATRVEHDQVYASISTLGELTSAMDIRSLDANGVTFEMDEVEEDANFASHRYFWLVLFGRASGFAGDPAVGHRFWRGRLLNEPGQGPGVNQLQVTERRGAVAAAGSTMTNPARLHPGIGFLRPTAILNGGAIGSPDGEADIDLAMMTLPAGYVPGLPTDEARRQLDTLFDTDGILRPTVRGSDGAGGLPLVKGFVAGSGVHGDPVVFQSYGRLFLTPPKVTFDGGLNHQPRALWGNAGEIDAGSGNTDAFDATRHEAKDCAAVDADEAGFTIRARLAQPSGASSILTLPFSVDRLHAPDESGVIATLTGVTADIDDYLVTVGGRIRLRSKNGLKYTVALHYLVQTTFDPALGWQTRSNGVIVCETESLTYEAFSSTLFHPITVAGLTADGSDQIRVILTDITEQGRGDMDPVETYVSPVHVIFKIPSVPTSYANKGEVAWVAVGYV